MRHVWARSVLSLVLSLIASSASAVTMVWTPIGNVNRSWRSLAQILSLSAGFLGATLTAFEPAQGVAITPSATWYQFSWFGETVEGCRPADPNGSICVPSPNGDSAPVGVPPWEFTAPSGGIRYSRSPTSRTMGMRGTCSIGGVSIGRTSIPAPLNSGGCGYVPAYCLADPNSSHGTFLLGPGFHSVTLDPIPFSSGAAMFRIMVIPEPATDGLIGVGLVALSYRARPHSRRQKD
jgi:outer membrane protein assembly factor BamB